VVRSHLRQTAWCRAHNRTSNSLTFKCPLCSCGRFLRTAPGRPVLLAPMLPDRWASLPGVPRRGAPLFLLGHGSLDHAWPLFAGLVDKAML
jgi:hypothetical protein